jgi:hypothetical protein
MPDNLIQVGAVFDGSQLKTAMDAAAAATEKALADITGAFAKLQADTSAQISALEVRLAELEDSTRAHVGRSSEAVGGLKLAFEDTGIAVNRHVARWLAELPLLGAAFSLAFPVVAIISFADSIFKAGEKMDSHSEKMAKAVRESLDLSLSFDKQAESVQISNLKLQDHISTLERKPAQNGVAIAAMEGKRAVEELIKSFQDAIGKENELLTSQEQGLFNKLLFGDSGINDILSKVKEYQGQVDETLTKLRLAQAQNNKGQTAEFQAELNTQVAAYQKYLNDQIAANTKTQQTKASAIQGFIDADKNAAKQTSYLKEEEKGLEAQLKNVNNEYDKRDQTLRSLQIMLTNFGKTQAELAKHSDLLGAESAAEQLRKLQDVLGQAGQAIRKEAESGEKAQTEAADRASKEAIADIEKQNQAALKGSEKQLEAWDESYKGQIATAKTNSDIQIQLIEQRFERGQITQQQEVKLIAGAKETELAIERSYQQLRFALWDGDVKKKAEIQAQIDKIVAQGNLVATKSVTDQTKATQAQYQKMVQGISSEFSTFATGILQGTETMGQAWAKMADNMAAKFIASLARQLVEMIAHAATKEAVDAAYYAKSGMRAAYDAAKKSFDWASQYVGPVLAAPIAAAAFIAVESMGSYDVGTNYVPQDGLAYLHKGETVIPASKQGAAYSGSGGGITVVVHHNVQAMDAASFESVIDRHSNMLGNKVAKVLKKKGFGQ